LSAGLRLADRLEIQVKAEEALAVIYRALRVSDDKAINDVQMDSPGELVLTTDDGKYQAWVINAAQLTETTAAQDYPR